MRVDGLIKWCNDAESVREASWNDKENKYDLSLTEALRKCKPEDAGEVESSIALVLLHQAWNEVQDWFWAYNQGQ